MLSFAVPTLQERRNELSARVAYFAYCLVTFPLQPHQRVPCTCCGQPGPGDWCNTCEVHGNHPLPNQPQLITPVCNACMADNVVCPICGVAPADGPAEEDMIPPGPAPGDGVAQLQHVGAMF